MIISLNLFAAVGKSSTGVTDVVTIVASIVLTLVTVLYVLLTYRILRANERSSEAAREASRFARETVEEMRQQRLLGVQPRLVVSDVRLAWYGDRLTSVAIA